MFDLRRKILIQFYRAVIESVPCFSLPIWYGRTTQDQNRRLNRVIRNAGRIVGRELPSLEEIFTKRFQCRQIQMDHCRSVLRST